MGDFFSDLGNSIGALFGGAQNNANFVAKSPQNFIQPFTAETVNQGLAQGQQGLQTAQSGIQANQALANALMNQGGLGNQANVFNQLQQVASGQGPNPAQAMLNQATGQNIQGQAALQASQRGAGANPALIARQAGQLGANAQQQAAGQAATLQAQQGLGALGQMGGIANQQVANQIGATQGLGQLSNQFGQLGQNQQQQMINALMGQNAQNIGITQGENVVNQAMAGGNAANTAKTLGGLAKGISATGILKKLPGVGPLLQGGGKAHGGEVESPKLERVAEENRFPATTHLPPHLAKLAEVYHPHHGFGHTHENRSFGGGHFNEGGQVDHTLKTQGGKVPGKAKYPGDNERNDIVPAKLSKGEIVLPNSVTQSEDPVSAAASFVAALESKKGHASNHHKEFKEALGRAINSRKKRK